MTGYRLGAFGIVITFFTVVTSTVLLPAVLFNPRPSPHANSYISKGRGDPLRGRKIYVREGCFYCHSQFTRLQDRGLGPLVTAGEFVNETPHQLGTSRTGPDLTNEGGKHPPGWQKAHLINPRDLKPGSIMPSFSYLSRQDMDDLVAYIENLGTERPVAAYVQAPDEYELVVARKTVDTNTEAAANAGRGIYIQNCSTCHGMNGLGNGPNSLSLEKKPANFTRPFYRQYSDQFWFYRVTEGVPGTRMPRWGETLSQEQRWYLVAYLKTLPEECEQVVNNLMQIDRLLPEMSERHTQQQWEPTFGQ